MSRICSYSLCLALGLASIAAVHGEDARKPRTDLYGDPLPPGAVARLGTIRLRHAGADVVFSHDGKQLISCGMDGEVRVWDATSGALLRRTRMGFPGGTWQISLAPDGAIAAVKPMLTGKLKLHLYDTKTGQERDQLAGAQMLAFSADGKTMAVQTRDNKGSYPLRLWDIVEFKKHRSLDTPPHTVFWKAAFAPDGKQLAAFGYDKSQEIFLWDTATGKLRKRMKLGALRLSLVYAPDGTTLAMQAEGKAEVVLLDAATLKEKKVLTAPANIQKPGSTHHLIFSPDGRLLAGNYQAGGNPGEYGVLLWDVNAPKEPLRLPSFTALAFAPDGKSLIYREKNGGEIRLWDVVADRQLQRRPGHDTYAQVLASSADGRWIASAGTRSQGQLWDASTGAPLHTLQGRDELMNGIIFSREGKCVVSSGAYGTYQLWDVASGKELRRIPIDGNRLGSARAAGFSADGKRLMAIVGHAPNARFPAHLLTWDLATGKQQMDSPYRTMIVNRGKKNEMGFLAHAAFSPDGERMTVWLGDRVGIEDIATGSLLATLPQGTGWAIQFSPNGRLVKTDVYKLSNASPGSGGSEKLIIEVASGEEVARLKINEFNRTAFTPDSRAVVETGPKYLRVWDALTGERLHEMAWPQEVPHEPGGVSIWSLAVLPNGRAATGMTEGDILIWDLEQEKWPHSKPGPVLERKELDNLWSDLASSARGACRAIPKLAAAPKQSVAFLNEHIRLPAALDTQRIEKLLTDLDSDSFAIRDAASQELARVRHRLDAMLRRALANKPSLEKRRRVEAILAEPNRPPREALRTLRAIAVLEHIGTPAARHILEKLAAGAASPETREAQTALRRLKLRTASAKEIIAP